jgi:Ser/Thr protein kinase RdoA (MazF antagonist)
MDIRKLLKKKYDLETLGIERLQGGFRNICYKISTSKKDYVLIVYKKEKGISNTINNAHFVAEYLASKNFPARIPEESLNHEKYFKVKFADGYHCVALYKHLPGETIPWEAYTRRHLKTIGKTLSDIHKCLREIPVTPPEADPAQRGNTQLSNNDQIPITQLQKWEEVTRKEMNEMSKYFKKVEPWINKKLRVYLEWGNIENVFDEIKSEWRIAIPPLLKLRRTGSEQRGAISDKLNILHYDFVRGNILFSDKLDRDLDIFPITGILDFEKVCLGPEIADIARTLAFLIVDCKFKNEKTIRKRFLVSGYEKRGKNSLPFKSITSKSLEILLKFFWLRDFWKLLTYNPYESLCLNEHYKRTRDRLREAGLLTPQV